jgi:predicted RNA binding protein YcfA (HicA-like mRNA interferase family)
LVQGYYKAVVNELRRLGFSQVPGGKGSHEKWADASGKTMIVPRNLYSRHTANGILRDAGSKVHV